MQSLVEGDREVLEMDDDEDDDDDCLTMSMYFMPWNCTLNTV